MVVIAYPPAKCSKVGSPLSTSSPVFFIIPDEVKHAATYDADSAAHHHENARYVRYCLMRIIAGSQQICDAEKYDAENKQGDRENLFHGDGEPEL